MLLPLSDSPHDAAYAVLARAVWPGVEFLVCREDISRLTHWRIAQPHHTVIVHLGGTMRQLETELDGAGRHHVPASPGEIWLVPGQHRYHGAARGQVIIYAELRLASDTPWVLPSGASVRLDALAPRMGFRDDFLSAGVAQIAGWIARRNDDLAAMMAEQAQGLLRQHLFRDYRPSADAPSRRDPDLRMSPTAIARLAAMIERRLAEPLKLQELADATGLTVHQLLPAFRQAFGTTPAQYILDARIKRARWMLLHRNHDIAEIALASGFCSHSHFSATFRRREGLSPAQFRAGRRTISVGGSPGVQQQ